MPVITIESTKLSKEQKAELVQEMTETVARVMNLPEAALVGNSPSNTVYRNGNDQVLTNLGVHEHWNNVQEKKYSRNFGKSEGIELILVDNN